MDKLKLLLSVLAIILITLTFSCGDNENEGKDNVKNKNESKLENDDKTEEGDTTYETKTGETEEEINNNEYSETEQYGNYSNTILVKLSEVFYNEYSTFLEFKVDESYYYNPDIQSISFAIPENTEIQKPLTKSVDELKNEFIDKEDKGKQYFIKYIKAKVLEGEAMGEPSLVDANLIDDYEVVGISPITATFTKFEMGDYSYYEFTTELGYRYGFNQLPDGTDFQLDYMDAENPYGKANPEYKDKIFKIHFHSEIIDNEYVGGKMEYFYIDKINLIE